MPSVGFAGHRAADLDLLQAHLLDLAGDVDRDQLVFANDHFVGDRVDDVRPADAAADGVGQADFDLLAAIHDAAGDALGRAAVVLRDDHVLADVGQLTGEVTRVGRLEGRIGQTLAGTVRRAEVLEHRQTFAEVRLDRRFDDFAARLGHQATHAGQLANLFDTAAGTRVRPSGRSGSRSAPSSRKSCSSSSHHRLRDLLAGVRPDVETWLYRSWSVMMPRVVQLLLLEHLRLRRRR